MERIRKLKAERSKHLKAANDIAAKASQENRRFSDEEMAFITATKAEITKIDGELKSLEELQELERTSPAETIEVIEQPQSAQRQVPSITGGEERERLDPYRGFPDYQSGGLGLFLHAVIQAGRQGRPDPFINGKTEKRLIPLKAAAGSDEHQGGSQVYGGFAVPVGFSARLLMLEAENDPTAGVTAVPMAVPSIRIPARVDKNHTSSVAGGITVGWRPETVALSSSRMAMEQISLTAHSLGGLSYVSEELLSDSAISFAALLEAGFRDAVTDAIIRARFSGVGAGEPLGILNGAALVSVDTTGQTTGTLTAANILGMRARCWRYSRAVWIANHDVYPALAGVHVAGTGSDSFLFNPARGIDVPDTLLGRPIIFSEYAQSLNTVGDIILAVWSEYLVGNYQGVQTAESMHVRFAENERAFRLTIRQAGEPWWRSALTPVNGANTLSPFVALATRTT